MAGREAGTALFTGGGAGTARGAWLLALSCACDGWLPNLQQQLLRSAGPQELMARSNLLGAVTSVLCVAVSGEAMEVLRYAGERPLEGLGEEKRSMWCGPICSIKPYKAYYSP